ASVSTSALRRSSAAAAPVACSTARAAAAARHANRKSVPFAVVPDVRIIASRLAASRRGSPCKSARARHGRRRMARLTLGRRSQTQEPGMSSFGRAAAALAAVALAHAALAQETPHEALAKDILAELVAINTAPSGGPDTRPAVRAMATRLRNAGFPADDIDVVGTSDRIVNLVARYRSSNPTRRPLLMMAHIDVVEALREDWTVEPYELTEKDGWYYGR